MITMTCNKKKKVGGRGRSRWKERLPSCIKVITINHISLLKCLGSKSVSFLSFSTVLYIDGAVKELNATNIMYEIGNSTNIIGMCQLNPFYFLQKSPSLARLAERVCCFKAVITSTQEVENFPQEFKWDRRTLAIYGHGHNSRGGEAETRTSFFSSSFELCLPAQLSSHFL